MEKFMKCRYMLLLILLIAVLSRAVGIGRYPVGINVDEAYAGYEAYSMLNYGIDSWGYHNPVYLTVWGSGMSVLESWLMMPFIRLGGLNLTMIRLPQMMLGVLSVLILYLLIRKTVSQQMALWAGLLIAVCPWHIMMSRWGLDANLAPAFILLGMYFSVLGLEKEPYFILAALFWGLSLYAYALMWIFVPVFLLFSCIYCIIFKKIKRSKYVWLSIVILGVTALPLMLFVAVNMGIVPEITTRYLSIPKMPGFRSDELTFSNIAANMRDLCRIYFRQNDYILMITIPTFGLYYLFSMPFMIVGGWDCLSGTIKSIKNRTFSYDFFLALWLVICTVIGIMRSMNACRANVMNLAVLILVIKGVYWLCIKFDRNWLKTGLILLYIISFSIFEAYYFTAYQEDIKDIQRVGLEQAVAYALDLQSENRTNKIHVTDDVPHPLVLFYSKCPADVFQRTVKWKNYPAKWVFAESFDCFVWDEEKEGKENRERKGEIYLISEQDIEQYAAAGYQTAQFGAYGIAY